MTLTSAIDPHTLTRKQIQAAIGALVGSAVGDALGAPFEFQPAGRYAARFPVPVLDGHGEMVGGGSFGWEPGEFTDDTQMAMALSQALLEDTGDFPVDAIWAHFKGWAEQATDIGNTTSASLHGDDPATAARLAHEARGYSASNGSLMRIAPIGIAGVPKGLGWTRDMARTQSRLTHWDELAARACTITALLIRQLILGVEFGEAAHFAVRWIGPGYRNLFTEVLKGDPTPESWSKWTNSEAVVCLQQAVWAVRSTSTFEDAVVAAVNLGDDTDTVAAVAGAIAGALYGVGQIPSRWLAPLHGRVGQPDGSVREYNQRDLQMTARMLLGIDIKGAGTVADRAEVPMPEPTAVGQLQEMVGMGSLKDHVSRLVAQWKLDELRVAQGMKAVLNSDNLVFTGAPGTGKTRAARLYADVLRELGILKKGHLVEVGRSDLVGGYIGHSALRTQAACEKALDGVLFIDEAYSLSVDGRDFGDEVISTLLTFMENNRGRIVVIVAGYPDEMEKFISSNPGLRSRFDHPIAFDRYTVNELLGIFESVVEEADFDITPSALVEVRSCLVGLSSAERDGNARTVRTMVYEMIAEHAVVLSRIARPSATQLRLLTVLAVPKRWARVGEISELDLPSVA